jgi:predicted flap endonuclease-1-like 5' DNA nuclease
MAKLSLIEGIGEAYEIKLNEVGIKSIEKLLEVCASKKGRDELAAKTGISDKLILKWANRADLDRISGVGSEYADLLEAAGVDTVPELANRKPENLLKKMLEVNDEKNLVRKVPTLKQVTDWVDQAGKLPRVLNY